MTQREIQRRHKKIKEELKEMKKQKERVMLEWEQLQQECSHPKKYTYSAMGDPGVACDDCGFRT